MLLPQDRSCIMKYRMNMENAVTVLVDGVIDWLKAIVTQKYDSNYYWPGTLTLRICFQS